MKVLLKKTVDKLGMIGDVVEVKIGYARNYLLPYGLAVEPTAGNIRAIEEEKKAYLERLARERAAMQERARLLQGTEVTIAARANEEGHLYGSIGPAQILAALAEKNIFIEAEQVALDEPIRQLDKHDVTVRFAHEIEATIHVWVVPHREAEEGQTEAPAPAESSEEA